MTAAVQAPESAFRSTKKKTIAASAIAGIGVLALTLGAPLAAQAALSGVISEGDLDVIEVEAAETSANVWDVELVGHDHDTDEEFDPAAVTYQVTADGGVGYIGEGEALSAGFSADNADFLAAVNGGAVTFTLESATRSGALSGSGQVLIDDGGAVSLAFDADAYAAGSQGFDLADHTHPDWQFSGTGTYELVFEVDAAPVSGVTINGLPDTVTVIVDVI